MSQLTDGLTEYAVANRVRGKGPLSVVLVVTRLARERGLPLDPAALLTERGGQVAGLGRDAVQAILREHGIERVLAEEGGRTSRGSIDHMRRYVAFLNELHAAGLVDFAAIEAWWIERVREHFAAHPFTLRIDPARSLRSVVRDLLDQAAKRQQEAGGTMYVGAVIQHLVGAKLDLLRAGGVEHHGFSVKDEATGRAADYVVGDAAIHVTTMPSEAVVQRCARNLDAGLRPVIITMLKGVAVAEGLAEAAAIQGRIDVFEIEQFVATNLYERSGFTAERRVPSAEELVRRYNDIIEHHETDHSLKIEIVA